MKPKLWFYFFLFISLGKYGLAQVTLTTSNLPIVFIYTYGQPIVPDSSTICDMGIIYNGPGINNNVNDPFNNYDGKISIKKRGSTSMNYPKSSYRFETQDLQGQNLNVSLIDMPKENDWILYGPYGDKSLMRNVLAYELAREMGWYSTRTKFCELVIDNEYMGVYVLIEKIKRDKNRVNITKITPQDTCGADLTGGYILQVDRWVGAGWTSFFNWNVYFEYIYPDDNEIVPAQENYIQNTIFALEDSLFNLTAFNNSTLVNIIDINSFIDNIILNEFSKNADAYRLSTYLFKDHDSIDPRIKMGPIWDYNIAFGNYSDFFAYQTENFIYSDTTFWPYSLFWFRKLMSFENFQNMVRCRWEHVRMHQLTEENIFSIIDSCYNFLYDAQQRNFQKWDILGDTIWPNYYVGLTYENEIEILKDWITERLQWLDENFPGECITTEISANKINDYSTLNVYPNPFHSYINLGFTLDHNSTVNIKLYDQYGRLILSDQSRSSTQGKQVININTGNLSPGLYYFQVMVDGKFFEVKPAIKIH